MTRHPQPPATLREHSLLERFCQRAEGAARPHAGLAAGPLEGAHKGADTAREGADAQLEELLETLAMALALEVVGELSRVPPSTREGLRRAGARALLQLGGLRGEARGDEDDEDRAEAVRLIGPYARDGLRALAGKEPPAPRRADAVVLDAELVGLVRGSFDGLRLAEIAWRVRESVAAQRALRLLRQHAQHVRDDAAQDDAAQDDAARDDSARDDGARGGARMRLAADGGASLRDPEGGTRIAELQLAGHGVELYRFDDGAIAAYSASAVVLRLGGAHVAARVARAGYAEASLGPEARRIELEVDGVTSTLELA